MKHLLNQLNTSGNLPLYLRLCIPLVFTLASFCLAYPYASAGNHYLLLFTAVFGAYMAINIGANDVANNVGPAVGSLALTLFGAIFLAGLFEFLGAFAAGGTVVETIKSGIVDPQLVTQPEEFVWLMSAALVSAAIWLNIATWYGAPVSTTHSIIGGLVGAGLAAGGPAIAEWGQLALIGASWIIAPVLSGMIAALLLLLVQKSILHRVDHRAAALTYVPILLGFMGWAFTTYLLTSGIKHLWQAPVLLALGIGLLIALLTLVLIRAHIKNKAPTMENSTVAVNELFKVPLVCAAALMSFGHGANDVANAIGPLAAINETLAQGSIAPQARIPMWIMFIGAAGIAVGLASFGPKLIRTVGVEITELDKARAFCIAVSAALTVILASHFGMPVSSTHITLGAVFGVGFLREYLKTSYASRLHRFLEHHQGPEREKLRRFLEDFKKANLEQMQAMLNEAKVQPNWVPLQDLERKRLKKLYKQELVKRYHLYRIVLAWALTLPLTAVLGAMCFFMLRGALLT